MANHLLNLGADVNLKSDGLAQMTPFLRTFKGGRYDLVERLVGLGCDYDGSVDWAGIGLLMSQFVRQEIEERDAWTLLD